MKWVVGFLFLLVASASQATEKLNADTLVNGYFLKSYSQIGGNSRRNEFIGPVELLFERPKPSKQKRRIALFVPQLSDTWQTFVYAVTEASKHLNLDLTVYSAKGYINLGRQIKQLTQYGPRYDGVILSAIDSHKMKGAIAEVGAKIPVIGYANEVFSEGVHSKAMVYYYDFTYQLGNWLRDYLKNNYLKQPIRVALVMGPKGASWSEDMKRGFMQSLKDDPELKGRLEFVQVKHGHTKPSMQERLVRSILDRTKNIDFLYGIAPAIERAAMIRNEYSDRHPNLKLIAPYINADLYSAIQKDEILVAANDNMLLIGDIAVANLLRLMRGERPAVEQASMPFVLGPKLRVLTRQNVNDYSYDALFGPKSFTPVVIDR